MLPLENRKWKVVGIFTAKGDPAASGALVRMEDLERFLLGGVYSYLEIKADSPENIPEVNGVCQHGL